MPQYEVEIERTEFYIARVVVKAKNSDEAKLKAMCRPIKGDEFNFRAYGDTVPLRATRTTR